jgi:hypothetical protein
MCTQIPEGLLLRLILKWAIGFQTQEKLACSLKKNQTMIEECIFELYTQKNVSKKQAFLSGIMLKWVLK